MEQVEKEFGSLSPMKIQSKLQLIKDTIEEYFTDIPDILEEHIVFKCLQLENDEEVKEYFDAHKEDHPYDSYIVFVVNILMGKYFFGELPKDKLGLLLDSIVLLRTYLKIDDLQEDTKRFIDICWKSLDVYTLKLFINSAAQFYIIDNTKYHRAAKALMIRNGIESKQFLDEEAYEKIESVKITKKDLQIDCIIDEFAPISTDDCDQEDLMRLPSRVNTMIIDHESQLEFPIDINESRSPKDILESAEILGIDCEWRPPITRFDAKGVALIQIASREVVFLIDIIALKDSAKLDQILTKIFTSETTIVGMDFRNDMKEIGLRIRGPTNITEEEEKIQEGFWQRIHNFYDISTVFKNYSNQKSSKLSDIAESLLHKKICKGEQISNWERRPLRKSQMHYAAVDAYILIQLFDTLKEKLEENERTILEFSQDLTEIIKTRSPSSQKGNQRTPQKKKVEKEIKIPSGPKIFMSDSLSEPKEKKVLKFYNDPMMKNLHRILLHFGFDSIVCPHKIRKYHECRLYDTFIKKRDLTFEK